jgi:hypothetical protein
MKSIAEALSREASRPQICQLKAEISGDLRFLVVLYRPSLPPQINIMMRHYNI